MAARILPRCPAEMHSGVIASMCTRERGHDGAHYSTLPGASGSDPIAWEGDDRTIRSNPYG